MIGSATAGLLAGAVLISFSAVFVRLVSMAPTASAFYRVLIGGLVLAAWTLANRESRAAVARLAATPQTIFLLVVAAVFFALDLAFWHRSIVLVGPGLATLLGNFQVFFLALAGVMIYGERLDARTLLAIPLALTGIAMIVGLEGLVTSRDTRLGVAFGIATAIMYAAYLLSLRRLGDKARARSGAADLAVISLASAALLVPLVRLSGESFAIVSAMDGALLVAYALVSQVIGWLLIARSLPGVPASRAGIILLLQPLLAFVWDVLFLSRAIGLREAGGAALALIAIWLGVVARRSS